MVNFFKKKQPTLEWASSLEEYPDIVVPARSTVPTWFKLTPKYVGTKLLSSHANATVKLCVPFLDALTTGYVVRLQADLVVEQNPEGVHISWGAEEEVLSLRPSEVNATIPIPLGCSNQHFVWKPRFSLKVPSGYSLMFTHPLNRYDLPFVTLTGVFDGNYTLAPYGNIPVFFSRTFEGVIPQGTPIAQLIPFKTQNWNSKSNSKLLDEGRRNSKASNSILQGWYKRNFWIKKTYN